MASNSQGLYTFEWVGCTLWTIFWGALAYVALAGKSITLGPGSFGLGAGYFEGNGAIFVGFVMLGAAAAGIGWLFRVNRYCQLQRFMLFVLWLGALISYVLLA